MTTGGSGMELKTEILIIGGGASGMAAACVIREMVSEWRLRGCGSGRQLYHGSGSTED